MADGQIRYKVGFDIQKRGLDQLKASLQDLQKMKISDIMKINGSTTAEAKAIFRDIQDQASKVEAALTKAFNPKLNAFNLQAFNAALASADLNLDKIYQDFSKAGTTGQVAFRQLSNQLLRVNDRVRESHAILDKMATTLANTIKWNAASGAVNGLTRSVQQAWGYVKALDGSLNDIRIVTGKSADDMANFAVQANNAAKELGRTTTDYTNAALIFAQQGLSDAEIEERAKITLKAANVTGQSTDAVSEQLTAVWNGYKVTAEEAQLYVDRLAAVAATTASDLEELSTGMSKVASAAAAMGVGEEQLAAQLSTIISVTRQAPETVGTALRTVYARISDIEAGIEEDGVTLGKYSGEMEALGFNVLDASGHLRDMGKVIQEIGGRWNYLTREQQVSLAQTMAGQRQYSNLIALFDNFQKYNQALYTAQNAAGTLQEQQDTAMESMGAHLNVLKASVQDVYDSLVNQDALNAIKGLIDGLAKASTTIAKLMDSIGGGIPILTSLGALGFSVFTNQIAGSIQTTINNFQAAQREAQELQRKIDMIEESRGQGDETTRALGARREEILSMSPNLSDSMTQELQKGLDDWVEAANKVDLTKAKFEELKGTFEAATPSLKDFILGYKDLTEALSTDTGIQQIKEGLKQVQKQFKPVEDSYKILREAVIDFNRQTDEVGKTKSFEFLKDQINELVNTLHSAKTDSGEEIFKTLPQEAQKSIEQAQKKIESLDFSALSSSEAQGQITGAFQQIAKVITNKIEAIKKAIESADDGTLPKLAEQLEAAKKALKATQEASDKQAEQATNAIRVKNLTDMASGFSRVAAGILQIKNLGRIWTQQDVSLGDKILQTVQNLAFSLPMLISGLKAASIGLKILTIEEGALAKATIKNIWGENAHAIAIKFTGDAAQEAAIKIKFFDQVLNFSSAGIGIAAVLALASAVAVFGQARYEEKKRAIKDIEQTIDKEKELQEELKGHKDLYTSLEQLDEKYHSQEISRTELQKSIQNLIEQYKLEGDAADSLREKYYDLHDAILAVKQADAQQRAKSAQREKNSYFKLLENSQDFSGPNNTVRLGSQRQSNIGESSDQITEIFKQYGLLGDNYNQGYNYEGKNNNFGITVDFGSSPEEMAEKYNQLLEVRKEIVENISESERESDTRVQALQKILTTYHDKLSGLDQSINEEMAAQADKIGAGLQKNGELTIKDSDNIIDYLKQREKIIDKFQKTLKAQGKEGNARDMADSYLKNNYSDMFLSYDIAAKKISEVEEKAGKMPAKIQQAMAGMTDSQMGNFIGKISDLNISNWEQWLDIIISACKVDTSNLDQIFSNFANLDQIQEKINSGKNISPQEYQTLPDQLKDSFFQLLDGSYKLKDSIVQINQQFNELKFDPLLEGIGQVKEELKSMIVPQQASRNLIQSAASTPFANEDDRKKRVNDQIDYIEQNSELDQKQLIDLENLRTANDLGIILNSQMDELASRVKDISDNSQQAKKTFNELSDTQQDLIRALKQELDPLDEDVRANMEDYVDLTSRLEKNAKDFGEEFEDALDPDLAEAVAEAFMRFDNAIEDANKNMSKWQKNANNLGKYSKELRDTYGDLLNMDGDALSESFVTSADNLNLMKEALEGNIDAYNQLRDEAQEGIWLNIANGDENSEIFQDLKEKYLAAKDVIENDEIKIGQRVDSGPLMSYLDEIYNQVLAAGGDTVEAFNKQLEALDGTGFVPDEITNTTVQNTDTEQAADIDTTVQPHHFTSFLPHAVAGPSLSVAGGHDSFAQFKGTTHASGIVHTIRQNVSKNSESTEKNTSATGVRLKSVKKGAGGTPKFKNATKKFTNGGSGGGGKGGGGGKKKKGGSSSTPKADTSTKDTKKPLKDDLDIYHDVNVQISKINKNLNRAQKQQQRLFGKDLLKNLTDQKDLLEEHNQKLKKKHELQVTDLANQKKILQSLGVTFDQYGNITNYMDVLQKKQKKVNDLINQYNKKVEQYNKLTDKTKKESLSKEIEKISDKIEDAEEAYKDLEDKIGNYDDLREEMQELLDQIQENTQQQIELTIQGFRTELEIRLDLGQAERNWNEFRRNVLQKTNVLKDMNFDETFKNALKSIDDIYTYIGKEGSIGTITTLMQQLEDTQAEIEQMNKEGGVSLIYGTNKTQAMEDLQSDLDQLMSQLEDIEDLVNEIDEAYLDTIDDIADQFDAQIQGYEYVGELLEHDMDLLSLLYGDKNYDAMNRYYTALAENNNKQLDFLREQANYWQQNWVKAMEEGNVQAAKEFEEHYKDTINNLNNLISESVENLQNKYVNAIEQIFDTLDQKITNGKGMDYLGMEWDLLNKNAEDYLDTINAAFAVQDLERKYNKALGETTSIKNQRALKKVMDEQLNNLKAKDKLTQYDVDRAEKLLEIEKARIALEDVRAQKTSLRLKRDSQGNYSYEYVADMDEVAEAQEALAAAQNDLYNFDKEQYQSNVDEVLAAWQDFQSEYKDIITDLSLTEEDRVNKLKLLREQYGKYINNKTAENAIIRVNLMDSAFADLAAIYEQDVQNYMQMADEEKDIIMNQLVPAWNSGIQEMANLIVNEGGFIPVCQQAFDNIAEVTEEYAKELQTLGIIAGVNFEELKEGADQVADGMASLIKQNDELISSMKLEMEAIDLLRKQAQQLSKDYNDVAKAAAEAVTKIQDFVKAQKTAAAQAANENKPATTASKNSSSSTTNKTASTSNTSNNNTSNKGTSSNTSSSGTSTAKETASKLAQDIYNKLKEKVLNGGSNSDSGQNKPQTTGSTGGGAVRRIARLATGGYTGEWNSEEGRLAFLHEKELVLNEQDTKNVLNSVSILRTLMGSLNTTVANKIFDLNHGNRTSLLQSVGNNENVSQAVQISATFPNVNSRREIEEAFNNLVNMAAQRALE